MQLQHRSHVSPPQPCISVICRVSDRIVGRWDCIEARPSIPRELRVPSNLLGPEGEINLNFEISNPRSPADLGSAIGKRLKA